ncbi:UDP-glucuronosyltransferase 2A1-like [Elysia marginata]|uniref:UDP-glucuronosyltransferase 2A1-like n=1 Tax=Elysia marginata TaxID=1093978 RepID=A0AAV4FK28_9GAST|nr:UDP-glucuronosyltransferase 2A1-like [Elysia marginata]
MIRFLYKRKLQLQIMTRKELNSFISEIIKTNKAWKDKLLVVGDFNAKVGKEKKEGILGPFGLEDRNNSGSLLLESFSKRTIFSPQTLGLNKKNQLAKHGHPLAIDTDIKSTLFCVTKGTCLIYRTLKYDMESTVGSDHKPVIITDEDGKLLQDDADILNRWTECIGEDLFNDERPEKPSIDVSDNLVEITTSEARNKSPGEDEIPAELLQALGTSGKMEISTLINDIEYLLQEAISEKSGILINGVNINNIRYADDTVILAESEEQLQAMLDRIVDKCKEYGMESNAKRTKTMHIGRDSKALTITVGKLCSSRYAGLISRGSSGPLLELSLEGKTEGKRGQGRPRRNWMDDVKEWSGSTSYGDTKRKAENREEWRDIVANLRTEDGS